MNVVNYPKKLLKPVFDYLSKQQKDLTKRMKGLQDEDPFRNEERLNDNASDDTEAYEQFGHQRSEALSKETAAALSRVSSAMKRIENGEYGSCVNCGMMIDTDRLGIDPTVELCIHCAKKK